MTYQWLFLAIFLYLWKPSSCLEESNDTVESNNFDEVKDNVMGLVSSVTDSLFPTAYKIIEESNISMSCTLSLVQFFRDIKKLKEWALKMFDATAKPPAGILQGSLVFFGDYDECLDIIGKNEKGKRLFVGKYCMLKARLHNLIFSQLMESNVTDSITELKKFVNDLTEHQLKITALHIGLCVPSVCTSQEINRIARNVVKAYGIATEVNCEIKTRKEPNTVQIVILCVFALFAFLVLVGTTVDLINRQAIFKISGDLGELLIAFSFYSNTSRLFRTLPKENPTAAINGCRVLAAFWIVLLHTYFWFDSFHFAKYRRLIEFPKYSRDIDFETIANGSLAVDTFFLISGSLFVYTAWKQFETKGWINPASYILSRMARLLPIEMLVIALFMILPLLGNGPIWDETFKNTYNNCRNNWWTNLLFIQNFWPFEQICLEHTWFLGALFQLWPFGFGLLIILYRWPKIGISVTSLLVIIGCIVTGILTSSYYLPSSFSNFQDTPSGWKDYFEIIHHRPHTYIPSYCIGILIGYAIVTKRRTPIKPGRRLVYWFLALCGTTSSLYGMHFLHSYKMRELHIVYATSFRTVWSLSVSWILFACVSGYGGIIGRIFSWKWMVLSDRISLLIYLLHPLVIYYNTARTRAAINMSHIQQVFIFLPITLITLWLAYLFNVTIEQPLNNLRLFCFRTFSKKLSPNNVHQTIPVSRNKSESLPSFTYNSGETKVEETIISKC